MAYKIFLVPNRRKTGFVARVHVPVHLRDYFDNKREIRRSCHTTEKSVARRRAMAFWLKCQAVFEEIDRMAKKKSGTIDIGYATTLLGHVVDFGGATDPAMAEKELALVEQMNQPFLDDPELLKAALAAKSASVATPRYKSLPLADLVDKQIEYQRKRIDRLDEKYSQDSFEDTHPRLLFWKAYFGGRTSDSLTKAEIMEIGDWLYCLPSNYTKKGLSILDAIDTAKKGGGGYPVIAAGTYNNYVRDLEDVLTLAFKHDGNENLTGLIKTRNTKQGATRDARPFTFEDMAKIFPGADYGVDFGIGGTSLGHDGKFMILLLGALSGARLEELCSLTTDDVKTDRVTGIRYFNITDKGEAADGVKRRTKNRNSVRPVPVHPVLWDIGLQEYIDWRNTFKKSPGDIVQLINAKRNSDKKIGSAIGKWFTNKNPDKRGYLERRGVITVGVEDGQKWSLSFHGFRHSVADNMRGKFFSTGERIRDSDGALVTGHLSVTTRQSPTEPKEQESTFSSYGRSDQLLLEIRMDMVRQIEYPGVDFAAIKWSDFKRKYQDKFL